MLVPLCWRKISRISWKLQESGSSDHCRVLDDGHIEGYDPTCADLQTSRWATALIAASHLQVVSELLKDKEVDVNADELEGTTVLRHRNQHCVKCCGGFRLRSPLEYQYRTFECVGSTVDLGVSSFDHMFRDVEPRSPPAATNAFCEDW
jgi:hypothetical protein